MICPMCKYPKSKVEKTLKFMTVNRRLRRCLNNNCRKYFFSNELVDPTMIFDESPIDDNDEIDEIEDNVEEKEPDLFSKN